MSRSACMAIMMKHNVNAVWRGVCVWTVSGLQNAHFAHQVSLSLLSLSLSLARSLAVCLSIDLAIYGLFWYYVFRTLCTSCARVYAQCSQLWTALSTTHTRAFDTRRWFLKIIERIANQSHASSTRSTLQFLVQNSVSTHLIAYLLTYTQVGAYL